MSCFESFTLPTLVYANNQLEPFADYHFSEVVHTIGGQGQWYYGCRATGSRPYRLGERIARALAGVFLTLLTGFFGLLSPQIRSLFYAQRWITVEYPANTRWSRNLSTLIIQNGQLQFSNTVS